MSEVPEMVERVARAICRRHGVDPDQQGPAQSHAIADRGDGVPAILTDWRGPLWGMWVDDARAAIEAMREETDAMADAGAYTITGDPRGGLSLVFDPTPVWRAMIDAALW